MDNSAWRTLRDVVDGAVQGPRPATAAFFALTTIGLAASAVFAFAVAILPFILLGGPAH
jgi:hypothetical protein